MARLRAGSQESLPRGEDRREPVDLGPLALRVTKLQRRSRICALRFSPKSPYLRSPHFILPRLVPPLQVRTMADGPWIIMELSLPENIAPCRSGADALSKLGDGRFDLILMDCEMPTIDGRACTEKIRKELKLTVPVVAATAYASESDRLRCFEAAWTTSVRSGSIEPGSRWSSTSGSGRSRRVGQCLQSGYGIRTRKEHVNFLAVNPSGLRITGCINPDNTPYLCCAWAEMSESFWDGRSGLDRPVGDGRVGLELCGSPERFSRRPPRRRILGANTRRAHAVAGFRARASEFGAGCSNRRHPYAPRS